MTLKFTQKKFVGLYGIRLMTEGFHGNVEPGDIVPLCDKAISELPSNEWADLPEESVSTKADPKTKKEKKEVE